jgi:beta-carotene hydroxylase
VSQDLTALNKEAIQAARRHMGATAWPTVALSFAVVAGFVLNLWLFATGLAPAWAATLVLAALTYFAYTPLHEAVHGNINGQNEQLTWLNDLCGYLMAPLMFVPYASHRAEHFTHHRYTNQPDKDPDYVMHEMGHGVGPAALLVLKFFWLQNTYFVKHQWRTATLGERMLYAVEVLVALGWRVAFLVMVDQPGAVSVIILGYLLGGFFTAYWFAYRPHLPYNESKRYRNTSSLIMPVWMKPLEWFWLGQNLHSIHHLFPRVPFYRYHALHREIEPILRAHGTPILGIFSREPVAEHGKVPESA